MQPCANTIYSNAVLNIFNNYPETDHIFQIDGEYWFKYSISGMVLKPWDERKRTSNQLQPIVQQQLSMISGAKIAAFQLPSLPGRGLPIQFVIKTTDSFDQAQ